MHSAVRSSRWPWQNPPLHDQSKISQQIPVQLQRALNSCVATHAADLLTRPVPCVLLFFCVITVLLLTFFSIKLLFLGRTHDLWNLSPQTDFCPAAAAAAARSRLHKQSSEAKRIVRNHCVLMILQFFHSPFFQLNCYFWGERMIFDISAHRLIFPRRRHRRPIAFI